MKTQTQQSIAAKETDQAKRKRLVQVLLAMVFLCSGPVIWLGFRKSPDDSVTRASNHSRPGLARASIAGDRLDAQKLLTVTVAERQPLENLWTGFLAAQAIEDSMEQSAAIGHGMQGMTMEMVTKLLACLSPEDLKSEAARCLFDYWATAIPGKATAWAQAQDDIGLRQSFMNLAALRWAVTDFDQAAAWARSMPEGEDRTAIMAAVGSEAVRSSPLEALRLGIELPEGMAQTELIGRAAAEWATKDRDSALEWAKQIEDENLRQQVTGQMVAAFADQDPVRAAHVAQQEMVAGAEQDRAVVTVIQHWVQTDPESASAWVSQFPDDPLGLAAVESLVNLWANQDLVESGKWLLSLPSNALQRSGVLAYARVLMLSDPELARHWVSSVMDADVVPGLGGNN